MKQKDEVRVDGKPVFYAVLYESFRKAALECGYALGLHGSMQRDMDLMAMAWVENPKPIEVLVEKINECIGETVWKEENLKLKEVRFGRHIYTLSIMGDWHLDLSIIPKPELEAAGVEELVRLVAYKAWKGAANAFRLYPDNNHTFHDYWDAAKNQFEEEIKPLNQYCHQNDDRYEQLKRDHIKLFDQSTEKDRTIAELTELLDKISNGQKCIVSRTGIGEYTIAFKPDRNTESDNQNQSK